MRLCGIYTHAGGQLGAAEFRERLLDAASTNVKIVSFSGIDGAGKGDSFGENVEDLRGGCACEEEWQGSALRDDAGDDYVFAGEGGSGRVARTGLPKLESRPKGLEGKVTFGLPLHPYATRTTRFGKDGWGR